MKSMIQNGTTQAHGRTWPMYERQAYGVKVCGSINLASLPDAETLQMQLGALLNPYGMTVELYPVLVLEMTPEDQAEKNALDELEKQ